MPAWLLVLVLCLATYRLTRLVTRDSFPASVAVRGRILDRWGSGSWQAYLVECDWCLGFWVAGLLCLVTALTCGLPAPLLVWPAASAVTGLLASSEPE